MLSLGQGVVFVGKIIYALAKKLSWLLPDECGDQKDVLKSLAMTGSVDIARLTAKRNCQGEWFEKQLQQNPDLPRSVKQSYSATRDFFRDDNDTFEKSLDQYLAPGAEGLPDFSEAMKKNPPGATGVPSDRRWGWEAISQWMDRVEAQPQQSQITDSRKFDYHFKIYAAPGQSEKAIADEVVGVTRTSPAFTGNNSMLDGGHNW